MPLHASPKSFVALIRVPSQLLSMLALVAASLFLPQISEGADPVFDSNSATIKNRYMSWNSALGLYYQGFGSLTGATLDVNAWFIEDVDGISCLSFITVRTGDSAQQTWVAQDTLGNVWQLRSFDSGTNEYHEEDVLYMPVNPVPGEKYNLWDITYSTEYTVIATDATVVTPLSTYTNCLQLETTADGFPEVNYVAPLVGLVRLEFQESTLGGYQLNQMVNFNPPALPFISAHPYSQSVSSGTATLLSIAVVADQPISYQWYQGISGETSNPIPGATNSTFQTPLLENETNYWVRVTTGSTSFDSNTATVTISTASSAPNFWGYGGNSDSKLGGPASGNELLPIEIGSDVKAIAAGGDHTLFITNDGSLWGLGDNDDGQLGETFDTRLETPVLIDTNVAHISAGFNFSLYVKTDGTLWGMGDNSGGQLGDGTTIEHRQPIQIDTQVMLASAGTNFSLYIKTNGTLMGTGENSGGQLGDGTDIDRLAPIIIASDVIKASGGNFHSHFITAGNELFGMGINQFGQLGDGTRETRYSPVSISYNVAEVSGGNNQTFFTLTDGALLGMGANIWGSPSNYLNPTWMHGNVIAVDAGISQNGVYLNADYTMRLISDRSRIANQVTAISVGYNHTLFIGPGANWEGNLYGMGENDESQLGLGNQDSPKPVGPLWANAIAVSAGRSHSLFIRPDNSLWGMGLNDNGQLGDGTQDRRVTSIPIATDVWKISAGYNYSLFIKTDRTLWGMGINDLGQLGNNTATMYTSPIQIDSDVIEISTAIQAQGHSLYLKSDDTLMGMGANQSGQLGVDNFSTQFSPIEIDTQVKRISVGYLTTFYTKTNNDLYALGWNNFGQLGDGTFESRSDPVKIDENVLKVSGGNNHNYYLKINGDLLGMGSNIQGLIGTKTETPIVVATEVTDISSGMVQNGMYVKSGGNLYDIKTISLVAENVASISVGVDHSLFIANASPFSLTPIPISNIWRSSNTNVLTIFAIQENISNTYDLYSSPDLKTWTLHPTQSKALVGNQLTLEINMSTVVPNLFFRVLGEE